MLSVPPRRYACSGGAETVHPAAEEWGYEGGESDRERARMKRQNSILFVIALAAIFGGVIGAMSGGFLGLVSGGYLAVFTGIIFATIGLVLGLVCSVLWGGGCWIIGNVLAQIGRGSSRVWRWSGALLCCLISLAMGTGCFIAFHAFRSNAAEKEQSRRLASATMYDNMPAFGAGLAEEEPQSAPAVSFNASSTTIHAEPTGFVYDGLYYLIAFDTLSIVIFSGICAALGAHHGNATASPLGAKSP